MLPESVSVLLSVVAVFERLGIPYLVSGSMASALYGVARSTLDADIVADIRQDQVSALVSALGKEFYADDQMIRDAIKHRGSFNLIHLTTMFKVDVFIRKDLDPIHAGGTILIVSGHIVVDEKRRYNATSTLPRSAEERNDRNTFVLRGDLSCHSRHSKELDISLCKALSFESR